MPGEELEELEEEEDCSLSGDEKTCLIGILFPFSFLPLLFSLLLLPRWSRIRKDSHFLLEEEEEVCSDGKQRHSVYLSIVHS